MQCKKALEEANGDMDKARVILQKMSKAATAKKADRDLGAGVVASYVHNDTVGSMVVLACETDFVSRNDDFKSVGREIAMHVAAMDPEFLNETEIDEAAKEAAKKVFEEEVKDKPADMQEKILQGKMDSYFKDKVLLNQSYIKDPSKTIKDLVDEATQKFGERVELVRFVRFTV